MTNLRISNGATVAEMAATVRRIGAEHRPAKRKGHHNALATGRATGTRATRTMVNRTDIGSRNGRLIVSRGEGPTGRVNPQSDARFVANPAPMSYVTTERRDTFDHEREANAGDRYRHNTAKLDAAHVRKLYRDGIL